MIGMMMYEDVSCNGVQKSRKKERRRGKEDATARPIDIA